MDNFELSNGSEPNVEIMLEIIELLLELQLKIWHFNLFPFVPGHGDADLRHNKKRISDWFKSVKNLLAESSYVTRLDVLKAVNLKTSRLSQ